MNFTLGFVIIRTMNDCQSDTLSAVLHRTLIESGLSHAALERATGVTRASILRFLRGDQSLRLDKADRLAAYLGLELRKKG